MRRFNPFRIEVLIGILLIAFCATTYQGVTGAFISFFKLTPPKHRSFDAAEWRTALENVKGFSNVRMEMVDDLIKKYDMRGWNQIQLRALLGEPLQRRDTTPPNQVRYDLREGLNLLIFEMDSNDHVIRYFIRRED